jgi:hypothetical protein
MLSLTARIERPLPFNLLLRGRARWSPTARVQQGSSETARCTSTGDYLACSLILLPSLLIFLSRNGTCVGPTAAVERAHSDRARSGSKGSARVSFHPFLRAGRAPGHSVLPSHLRESARLSFTARIGRAQFHRARSASKKDGWRTPDSSSF